MRICKAGIAQPLAANLQDEMAAINALAKTELTPEEVYVFAVLLCDNEVDRDFERFTEDTLKELSELFVGATGIADHTWSAGLQKARIYRTELLTDEAAKNALGAPYLYLKGHAYMLRTEGNAELIAEIEGGIKRETSVGCSVARSLCSICGEELGSAGCSHIRGREYDGKLCFAELSGAVDAYEWSFVAVPAQRRAGVMKGFSDEDGVFLKRAEHEELQALAAAGRRYLEALRAETLRLSLLCDRPLYAALEKSSAKMDEAELAALKASFERRLEEKFPPLTQLPGVKDVTRFDGGEYLV